MKIGDVFNNKDVDQLYIVDAVTPSGSVFAHKFDLDKGPYDQPIAFPSTIGAEILFNAFEPEEETRWEYCKIVLKVHPEEGYPNKEWMEAMAEGKDGIYVAGTSQTIGLRGESFLYFKNEEHEKILKGLLDNLIKDDWQIVLQRRHKWYDFRLKRKLSI
jgi:hypothetical protein